MKYLIIALAILAMIALSFMPEDNLLYFQKDSEEGFKMAQQDYYEAWSDLTDEVSILQAKSDQLQIQIDSLEKIIQDERSNK